MPDGYYERNLPHWYPTGTAVFVTWRLYGSLPASFRFARNAGPRAGEQFARLDRVLDNRRDGPLWLTDPKIAALVEQAIYAGSEELQQFTVRSYVVMANHVHLLIEPRTTLAQIMRGIKGVTARRANQILGRTGKVFWQDESFDHWVRDDVEEMKIHRYIEQNPVRAGFVARPQDWPWSSAAKK